MKRVLTFLTALLLTTAAVAQTTPATTDPTQDPTALGNAFFKAMLDEDGNAMGKLLADNFTIISFDGQTVDKDLLLQGVNGGYLIVETGTVSGATTRQYNNDAAVMTGNWKAKGSVQGQAFSNDVAFSLVSAKQGNGWKIVNVQLTPSR